MAKEKTHEEQIKEKLQVLTGRAGEIAQTYLAYADGGYSNRAANLSALTEALLAKNPQTTGELFANGPYQMVEKVAGKRNAAFSQALAARLQLYIYARSTYRRSFRTKDVSAYIQRVQSLLAFVYMKDEPFDLAYYLRHRKGEDAVKIPLGQDVVADWIALAIDNGDQAVIDTIKEACLGDNNTAQLDTMMILGVLRSANTALHELLRDLLLAAKLQEGLRQSILESADSGRLEAFVLLLKTVIDNDLMRYSSAVRAADVWMGLDETSDDSRRRVTEKLVKLAHTYLTDDAARKAAEDSADVLEIYVSLWASSVFEITAVGGFLDELMRGAKYQKLVAMYFVSHADYPKYKAETSVRYIGEDDLDVLTYVIGNIGYHVGTYGKKADFLKRAQAAVALGDADYRDKLFVRLLAILPAIPQEGHTVAGKPFGWCSRQLTRGAVFAQLFTIAGYENDGKRNAAFLAHMEYADSDSRLILLKYLIDVPQTEPEREYNFTALSDKSMTVRTQALENIKAFSLRESEDEAVLKLLSLKTGDIRQGAVQILLALPAARVDSAVQTLLADKMENKRLAGLDMLLQLVKENKCTREKANEYAALMPKVTEREKVLLGELTAPQSEYTAENGFGLYDTDYAAKLSLPMPKVASLAKGAPPSALGRVTALVAEKLHLPGSKNAVNLAHVFRFSAARMTALFDALVARIVENKDYTFTAEGYNGQGDDIVLGTMRYMRYRQRPERGREQTVTIDNFVLPDVWRGWLQDNKVAFSELLVFMFANHVKLSGGRYNLTYAPWANKLIHDLFCAERVQALVEHMSAHEGYGNLTAGVISLLRHEFPMEERFALVSSLMAELLDVIPAKAWMLPARQKTEKKLVFDGFDLEDLDALFENESFVEMASLDESTNKTMLASVKEISFIQNQMTNGVTTDEQFAQYVAVCFAIGKLSGMTYIGLEPMDVARAYEIGLVPRDALLKMMFRAGKQHLRNFSGKPSNKNIKESAEKYPVLRETAAEAAARIIEIEIKRGDTPTEVSELARSIRYHEGAANFVNVLVALGNEMFVRGYSWYGSDVTKKAVLSNLLKASHPAQADRAETLKKAIDGRINEKRLLEAAMYAPAWLPIVAEYLGWKGLESAAWYFHAHINEGFSAEKETEVARYSPITPQEFTDGAFDVGWFKDAYKTLGKTRFEVLYDCAKYLTEGANHRRAQLFADATLGELKIADLEKEIKDKRNKDKLLAYSLIALKRDKEKDLLKRYEFIQAFLKESKQFGAQRRESEGKCCAIALDNLARTAGFTDSLRFSWRMETLKVEQLVPYFVPKDIDGVTVYVAVDALGAASLICEKAGKALASIPAKLKKDKYIEECREVVSSLKAQQKRAKTSLENAMVRRDSFAYGELSDLMKHPVISPLLRALLFASAGKVALYDGFEGADAAAELRIAHSHDLYLAEAWLAWQKYAFANKLVQPFKQIFRELYLPNADELHEKTLSRRYAGHQVQVQKTVALLKSRGWTVDYEDGLQKVYYKENMIATMYAAADWFSPADTEAPTLETVHFFDRKTREAIPLADVPPVLFSEVMRDIDLVVSVAHIGGVDPEASHSTVEMRGAIVRELLALLRVENAEVRERHTFVKGSLGEYTVHLGSGGVQMMGKGAINILAVPSQHRGRVFLPFADEDPRTAEIMSKILLLADDKTIKDSAILEQIGR